ncbi:22242_t:CDS:2 [Cetraspora pellucida]|uniref:22242_t:CDS:1 n=1 Tax=Cetraspora pellucida TaxID=1433469 RepID=A0A9N9FWY1_9GLOM|nr:22242_t:CDS:2 [Cetraspora pellucida]
MINPSQIKEHESTSKKDYLISIQDEDTSIYMHNFYEYLFNGNVGAPVHEKLQNGAKVLAFRCDSDIWITKVAAEYPNSKFYAVDSTIPDSSDKFNNITFIEYNVFKKISFPDNEFDYVFSRDKFLLIEKTIFQEILSEIFRVLKPGGISWLKAQNISYDILINFENYLYETGKTEYITYRIVETQVRKGYAFGDFLIEIILMYYRSVSDYLASFMNISFGEYDDFMNNVESELNAKDNKTTIRHKQVLARKKCTHSEEN